MRVLLACALALSLSVPVSAEAMDAQAVFAKAQDSVVVVLVYDSRGNSKGLGSGFFVGHGDLVVTNYHVINKATGLKVKAGGEQLDVVEVKAVDEEHDLALLRVSGRGKALELATAASPVGAEVVAIGTPLGLEKTVSTGIISGIRKTRLPDGDTDVPLYQMTAPISPGSSGGPVLDAKGRVLGVSTAGVFLVAQNINFAVPATYVEKLMGKRGSSGIRLNPDQSVGIKKDASGAIHIFSK